ncbi:CAAX geranylgeranyltransferase alpha subunit [Tulasnella sp. 403]|nr:CAAX geranylgeranyltransferase alpha subunit [Tulasnella sp. 403]
MAVDAKNYHTWAYRQWLLAEFNSPELWAGELDFVEEMLKNDIRNNSAWNHRFFVVWITGVREGEEDREEIARREIDYTKEKISVVPNNASAWNYLRGVLQKSSTPFSDLEAFVVPYTKPQPTSTTDSSAIPAPSRTEPPTAPSTESDVIDFDHPKPSPTADLPAPLALEFLADVYVEKAKATSDPSSRDGFVKKANELFTTLASELDTIRKRYWEYRKSQALKLVSSTSTAPS